MDIQHDSTEHGQIARWWHNLKHQWGILLFGQAVCILGSVTGATQSQLSLQCNWSAPGFSVFLFYSCLTGFLIPLYIQQRKQHVRLDTHDSDMNDEEEDRTNDLSTVPAQETDNNASTGAYLFLHTIWLQAPPWFYLIMGSLDVSASYCIVAAFSFTNITSVSLLTALSIPTTMILSCSFLKRRYYFWHYVGVALCLFGIVCRVGQDWKQDHHQQQDGQVIDTTYPHKFWGDLLACMGGVFFGVNNVLGEVAVQKLGGPLEFLGMMGFFAAILAFVYAMVMEREEIHAFFTESTDNCPARTSTFLLMAYVATNVLGYYGGAHFLRISEATFFNLSFQTGSLWSVLFSIIGQHIYPDPLFYVSLVITVSGVVVYELASRPHRDHPGEPASPEPASSIHLRELS